VVTDFLLELGPVAPHPALAALLSPPTATALTIILQQRTKTVILTSPI
jgi:hypothetical protein